jgi:hypothetical protein
MLFREMNGGYYDKIMGRKHSAWQKYGFNIIAACTCVYHRPETVKSKVKVHLCTGTEALYRPYGP